MLEAMLYHVIINLKTNYGPRACLHPMLCQRMHNFYRSHETNILTQPISLSFKMQRVLFAIIAINQHCIGMGYSFGVFSNQMMKLHHQYGGTRVVQGECLVEVFSRGLVQFSPQVSNDKTNPTLDCVQTFQPRTIMLMPLVILNSIFGLILTSLEQNDWANSKEICFPKWRR